MRIPTALTSPRTAPSTARTARTGPRTARTGTRTAVIAVAALVAVAISACGSTTTKTVTVTPRNAATSTAGASPATATANPTESTSTNATASTPSSAAVTPRLCRAGVLALTFLGQQGAVGHGVVGFALRNTGSASCHTFGYPGISWLSKTGAPLPTNPMRTTRDFFGPAPLTSLTVAPGSSVSFRLGVTHMTNGGGTAACTTAAALQVIPPNDTSTLRVTIPSGVFECRATTVTPVQPGKSAFQL